MAYYLNTPGETYPAFRIEATFEEVPYRLAFRWLERMRSWYLDIFTDEDEAIATGIRIDVNRNLFAGRNERLPKGYLLAVDEDRRALAPQSQADLGDRVKLVYFEPDELVTSEANSNIKVSFP